MPVTRSGKNVPLTLGTPASPSTAEQPPRSHEGRQDNVPAIEADDKGASIKTAQPRSHRSMRTTPAPAIDAFVPPESTRASRRSSKEVKIAKAKEEIARRQLEEKRAATRLAEARLALAEVESTTSEEESENDSKTVDKSHYIEKWLDTSKQAVAPPVVDDHQPRIDAHTTVPQPVRKEVTSVSPHGDPMTQRIELKDLVAALNEGRSPPQPQPTLQSQSCCHAAETTRFLYKLPEFHGACEQWLNYRDSYRETAHLQSRMQNISRLRQSLKGVAYEAVEDQFLGNADPEEILKLLESRFGRPDMIVMAKVEQLRKLPKCGESPREICMLSSKISNVVSAIGNLGKERYLDNPEITRILIEKLPTPLKFNWYKFSHGQKEDEPELKKLARFMRQEADCCSAFAEKEVIKTSKEIEKKATDKIFLTQETSTESPSTPKTISCAICKENHKIYDCSSFKEKSSEEKWNIAKKQNLCFRCLRVRRRGHMCKRFQCGINNCTSTHHKLLHRDKTVEEEKAVVTSVKVQKTLRTYLKIVPERVIKAKGHADTYALLDEGSTVTLINTSLAQSIGADGSVEPFTIEAIAGAKIEAKNSKKVTMKILGLQCGEQHEMTTRTLENLKLSPQTVDEAILKSCPHLSDIADQLRYVNATPTILIGQDNWVLTVSREVRTGSHHLPIASRTSLGWVLHGYKSTSNKEVVYFVNNLKEIMEDDIEELIKHHFALESLGVQERTPKKNEDRRALQILENTSRRLPDGRFETGLLWKQEDITLPNNYNSALTRLYNLEKKLDKDEILKRNFKAQMDNLIESGYAERVDHTPPVGRTWYLPHFAVINPAKPKIRIVHDAAAKTQGTSLNEQLLSGPDLLQSLPGVLLRFRQKPIAVSADIKEMFLQIRIRTEDRDSLRFLWRDDRREGPPYEYRMTSVIFGATSSPCTAIFIKNKNAEEFREEEPEAAEAIIHQHYMDDYLQSFDDTNEATRTVDAVIKIHDKAKFHIQKWVSNAPSVIRHLPPADLQRKEVELDHGNRTEKVLGIIWKPDNDVLAFNLNIEILAPRREKKITKREILRIAMTLFDPLGFATPVTIQAKHLIQELWRLGTGWDEEVNNNIQQRWKDWLDQVRRLEDIAIPRCYYFYSKASNIELHTFVDASEEAYSTAIYWRLVKEDGTVQVCLIAAKGRVAPLKLISIPRLELQAAMLGSRLARTIEEEHERKPSRRIFWTDSKTVLAWVRTGHRSYKPFVAHRIAEIEELTRTDEWRWVPSRDNVADDATRRTPDEFNINHRWFNGPEFLYQEESHWPIEDNPQQSGEPTGEERARVVHISTTTTECPLPRVERFSSWLRLIRATARVLQAIALMRRKYVTVLVTRKRTKKNEAKDPTWGKKQKKKVIPKVSDVHIAEKKLIPLEAEYMRKAEELWITKVQRDCFGGEIDEIKKRGAFPDNSRLKTLSLMIDEEGRLRLRSRIEKAEEIEDCQKHPIVLDGRHPYVRLYIAREHGRLHHASTETVVNEIRQRFWALRLRTTTRDVIKRCLQCRIRKAKPPAPATGDLPIARLSHHQRPFSFIEYDYFGPLSVTVGRQHQKRYVALFTCLTTRAVHLELAASLSAASAICALRRMIARRGCPAEIYSDNGTNFHGADNQLRREVLNAVKEEATNKCIKWHFIPAGAPFMGGAWERLVQSVKRALQTTLHERHPTEEVLMTLLAEVENTVNSRPLTYVSCSPEDTEAITPNHFILGGSPRLQTLGTFDETDLIKRDRWRQSQQLANIFWKRWIREYLPTLQQRREASNRGRTPEINDQVVIIDESLPRNAWPRGRVIATYPGNDGVTRVVDVETLGGVLRRPVKKIVALPR